MIKNNELWLERAAHIEKIEAENAALKEQVAIEEANGKHWAEAYRRWAETNECAIKLVATQEQLTTLQSKSAALVDALEKCAMFKLQPDSIQQIVNAALAAFKGEK